ncbi:MAG: transcription elongation factor GreA [Candidatus Ryanbacteria bacterium CG10_big_fil_rev_8_21_14_0_10_43_42]|uniref:Transcription elongation factor GreA n=1 Tax=Candidatus Ryanbacteria bacterium CG10_big_fil_rev_8_21_14_0_10_43_42 TaxID=1974864 RepID=A0A2M8KW01_9BACT|nr:MAG: transcription elongation factor GreA [Candidatus Ryanbacteria bacterium CG10_big_fil_rev_8_21_14_0_10_43_42]
MTIKSSSEDSARDNGSIEVEHMSKEGYAKIEKELARLKTEERLHIAERLEYAKSLGDLSENAEFDAAKEEQMLNEMRIRELEDLLSRATVVEKPLSQTKVEIGSCIIVQVSNNGVTKETYTIVGSSEEADPLAGLISNESPLGHAFMGKKKGEVVRVAAPKGDIEYVIIEIA